MPPANDILSWVKGHKISKVVVMANSKFDYKLIDEPEDILKCSICLEVAKGQPMQHGASTGCGKIFCKECIEKNGSKPCPMCRENDPKYFEDVRSKLDVLKSWSN